MWVKMIGLKWYGSENYDGIEVAVVPEQPGVYKIHGKYENGEWRVVYIGQTKNLNAALRLHLQSFEPNQNLRTYLQKYVCGFSYAAVPDSAMREQCYRALCEEFEPELNEPANFSGGPQVRVVNL